jgi:hypothetical protein
LQLRIHKLIQIFLYAPILKLAIVSVISISLLFTNFFSSPRLISSGYSESIQLQTKSHTLSQSSHDNQQQQQQQPSKVIEAAGHFANNQIENGTVTWIQGGLWHLDIYNSTSNPNNETNSMNNIYIADFSANFTMIKPDGSLSHEHMIKNFTSDNVILAENDIIVTGVTDIYTNNNSTLEYNQIPITVHLMGKKVLGLMIDVKKTERHFASSNELFGTLISGTGLEDTELLLHDDKDNNNMKMDEMMAMPHS